MSEQIKPTESSDKTTKKKVVSKKNDKLAVILIRGLVALDKPVKDTLFMLRLRKKHTCVILENTDSNKGMIRRVKDYVAFGEIDEDTLKELLSKRGKADPNNEGKIKPFFELAPPKGGFERKGIKKGFNMGGALGNRGSKINDLIMRML
jgi:large subunit ribosomal protein L30